MAQYKRKGADALDRIAKIYSLYKDLNIADNIKIRRLECAGHTIRMKNERIPKNSLTGKFHNARSV